MQMRIAILILAHKNQTQLRRLVERLSESFDIYIHLDKKSELPEDLFHAYPNVICIKKYAVNWGSYNGVLAPMELLEMAAAKGYDYYFHISGQDLPIKSNNEIIDFVKNNSDTSFVEYHALPWNVWGEDGGLGRLEYYWEHNLGNTFFDKIKKLFIRLFRERIEYPLKWKRKLPENQFYGGPNWLNLNKEAGKYVADYLKTNPDFKEIFKYTVNADEIWVQTVLKTGNLKIISDCLRCVDWSVGATSPKTFKIEDVDQIMSHPGLFARKFDETLDNVVIQEILNRTK